MRKLFCTILLLVLIIVRAYSQDDPGELLKQYAKSKPDTARLNILISLGSYYLLKPLEIRSDLDSALLFATEAKNLSHRLKYNQGEEQADYLVGWIYVEDKNPAVWNILKQVSDSTGIKIMLLLVEYKMNTNGYLAKDLDTAFYYCQMALAKCDAAHMPGRKVDFYGNMLSIALHRGNNSQALLYGLEAEKMLDNGNTNRLSQQIYADIGRIYFEQDKFEQSITYYKKAILASNLSIGNGIICKNLVKSYIKNNQPEEALDFVNKNVKAEAKYSWLDRQFIAESKGHCYQAMGKYEQAEQYFLESLESSRHAETPWEHTSPLIASYNLADLYVQIRQYRKAKFYLDLLETKTSMNLMPIYRQKDVELLYSRTDSALGNYIGALRHMQRYQLLNDSIFNETKNKQFEELKMQYETEKKDKDIKLKEQNIALLKKEDKIKSSSLEKTTLLKNLFIGGAILLFILLVVIYNRYRHNQKTNMLLQSQQEKINQSNCELQQLNEQQTKLLVEKDWLVKEIHHRVKNNLQMIVSLLNAQTEFLTHPSAIDAIKESRERMQAIAIIHQKLYQLENNTRVNMHSYINELVDNIKHSFADSQRIVFKIDADDVGLDISQSVPLGLILNEAITNAVKYAYAANESGTIQISLKHHSSDQLQLKITDNGKGIPSDINIDHSNSLGLQLIKLFSEQLEGELYFINNNGLEIILNFKTTEYKNLTLVKATA